MKPQTLLEHKREAWYPVEDRRHYSGLIRGVVLGAAMLYGFLAWVWIVYAIATYAKELFTR